VLNMSTKPCSMCKEVKSVDEFDPDPRYKSGYKSQCRTCKYTSVQRSRLNGHLKLRYGVTVEDWDKRLEEQGGVCAICGLQETRITRPNAKKYLNGESPRLSMDHSHKTGLARGLLCYKCNIGIGHLQESIANLEAAIEYLKKWDKK